MESPCQPRAGHQLPEAFPDNVDIEITDVDLLGGFQGDATPHRHTVNVGPRGALQIFNLDELLRDDRRACSRDTPGSSM